MAGIKKDDTYELIAEWLDEYNSAKDRYKKAKANALIATLLPSPISCAMPKVIWRAYTAK